MVVDISVYYIFIRILMVVKWIENVLEKGQESTKQKNMYKIDERA